MSSLPAMLLVPESDGKVGGGEWVLVIVGSVVRFVVGGMFPDTC